MKKLQLGIRARLMNLRLRGVAREALETQRAGEVRPIGEAIDGSPIVKGEPCAHCGGTLMKVTGAVHEHSDDDDNPPGGP